MPRARQAVQRDACGAGLLLCQLPPRAKNFEVLAAGDVSPGPELRWNIAVGQRM